VIARQAKLIIACACSVQLAWAGDPSFKLTAGSYGINGGGQTAARGLDVNLRNTSKLGNLWVGWYVQPAVNNDETTRQKQWRTGWDNTFNTGRVRVQPTLQAASGGFWGASFGVETGDTWYVGAGLGRTNLRPYVNLNFDPNDALMASGGYRWSAHQSLGFQWVRDNRLNPDQRHFHAIYRQGLSEHERVTFDVLSKAGSVTDSMGNVQKISKLGLSATYDWHEKFVRLSYDPNANFGVQNMWRFSLGTRF
jgi:hypothetical protein